MKKSWKSEAFRFLILLMSLILPLPAAERSSSASKTIDEIWHGLRAYQPREVLKKLESAKLPANLKALFTGWSHHQLGDYREAAKYLRQVDPKSMKDEPYLEGRRDELLKTAIALDKFKRLETPNFSIRYQDGPDQVLALFLPEILERIYASNSQRFHFQRGDKIILELMPDHQLFSFASALTKSQIETTGTIALCVENRLVVLTPRRVAMGYDWADTIAHEFIHYVMTKQSEDRAPLWLQEGVAKTFEGRWEKSDSDPLGPTLESCLARVVQSNGRMVTIKEMSPSFAALPTAELAKQAYAQVASMVEFMIGLKNEAVVPQLVQGLRDRELDAVLKGLIQLDFSTFEARWREWVKTRNYRVIEDEEEFGVKLLDKDENEEALAEVTDREGESKKFQRLGDLLLQQNRHSAALKLYLKSADAQRRQDAPVTAGNTRQAEHLPLAGGTVGAAAPSKPLSRQMTLRLVRCYQRLNQPGEVVKVIDQNMRNLNDDPTMLVTKAGAWMELGQTERAKTLLDRAVRVNPFYPLIYELQRKTLDPRSETEAIKRIDTILSILKQPPPVLPPSQGEVPGKGEQGQP